MIKPPALIKQHPLIACVKQANFNILRMLLVRISVKRGVFLALPQRSTQGTNE
jgi:hypothetical protein